MKWFLDAANDDIVEAIELQFAMEDIQNSVKNSQSPVNAAESSSSGITLDQLLLQITGSQSEL